MINNFHCNLTFRMYVAGFEAFVLETVINLELLFLFFYLFFKATPRQALHSAFIFSKRAGFFILTYGGPAA